MDLLFGAQTSGGRHEESLACWGPYECGDAADWSGFVNGSLHRTDLVQSVYFTCPLPQFTGCIPDCVVLDAFFDNVMNTVDSNAAHVTAASIHDAIEQCELRVTTIRDISPIKFSGLCYDSTFVMFTTGRSCVLTRFGRSQSESAESTSSFLPLPAFAAGNVAIAMCGIGSAISTPTAVSPFMPFSRLSVVSGFTC